MAAITTSQSVYSLSVDLCQKILFHCPLNTILAARFATTTFAAAPSISFWEKYTAQALNGKVDGTSTFQLAMLHFKTKDDITRGHIVLSTLTTHMENAYILLSQSCNQEYPQAIYYAGLYYVLRKKNDEVFGITRSKPLNEKETPIFYFIEAAKLGHVKAQRRAGKWLLQSAVKLGHVTAQRSIVARLLQDNTDTEKYRLKYVEVGIDYLASAISKGNRKAFRELGFFELQLDNSKDARLLLNAAAKKGDLKAFAALAKMEGFTHDKDKIPFNIERDGEAAKFLLGIHLAKKFSLALQDLKAVKAYLCEHFPFYSRYSEVCLGLLLQSLSQTETSNPEQDSALKFLTESATSIDDKMAFRLGILYSIGKVVPRNEKKVLHYFNAIQKNKCFRKLEIDQKAPMDLLGCIRFMKILKNLLPSTDPLHEMLKTQLRNKLLSLGTENIVGMSIAQSLNLLHLYTQSDELINPIEIEEANMDWVKGFCANFGLDNSEEICLNVLISIKQLKGLWYFEDQNEYTQKALELRLQKPISMLERYLLMPKQDTNSDS